MQFKALDSVLQTVDSNGEKRSLSNKCSEVDKAVPELLGVSQVRVFEILKTISLCARARKHPRTEAKYLHQTARIIFFQAILDHVIFCHQEESSWPFDVRLYFAFWHNGAVAFAMEKREKNTGGGVKETWGWRRAQRERGVVKRVRGRMAWKDVVLFRHLNDHL